MACVARFAVNETGAVGPEAMGSSGQSGRRNDRSVVTNRLQNARQGTLESPERPQITTSDNVKVDQPGKVCLVTRRFVTSLDDGAKPPLRVPWTCFEISLR